MSYKGKYKVKNPSKYRGDFTNCIFRSLWERKFMKFCDTNKRVLRWSSEEIKIPYRSPFDNKIHRYFVDFWLEVITEDNKIVTYLIEIKPKKQTKSPLKENKKMDTSTKRSLKTYILNKEKWKAAENYSKEMGWKFLILTEGELFGGKK